MAKQTSKAGSGDKPIRRVRTKTFPVKFSGALSAADARKAITDALRTIPDSQLGKFRAGHIMLVM